MRCYVNINSNTRGLVSGLGTDSEVSQITVKRRDAGDIELMLFSGEQGAAAPYKLADAFEMRFACKAQDDWAGEVVVLETGYVWRPLDQVYSAAPNFNTTQLNALFAEVDGEEPAEVILMAEFSWRDMARPSDWTSTATFTVIVKNDVIRGDEGDPTNAETPTDYPTFADLATGFVKTNEIQSLSDDQKNTARENIGALGGGEVVSTEQGQGLTSEQQGFARENIGAAAASDITSINSALALKADAGAVTALASVVAGKAAATYVDAADNALDARLDVVEAQLAATSTPRPTAMFLPVGNGTTVSLVGALNAATGTAAARTAGLLDAGSTLTYALDMSVFVHATGYALTNDAPVMLSTTSAAPGGFNTWTQYFVKDYDTVTRSFKLSLTVGGSAISRSSNGSGTNKVHKFNAGIFKRALRIGYVSAATAGSSAGTRHSQVQWRLADDAIMGGWRFRSRFGNSDNAAVANARLFVGMINRATVLPNGNPSALVNLIGVGADTGQSNLAIIHNDGTGTATKFDLGADFPANTINTDLYELELKAAANGASVTWKVTNLTTAIVAQGTVSTDLPTQYALLAPQHWRNNGSTALAVGLDVLWWTLEGKV